MARSQAKQIDLKVLKRDAKRLRKASGIKHVECLNIKAKEHGYKDWFNLIRTIENESIILKKENKNGKEKSS